MVGPSYMKFGQQFEINELYVCTKFRGNRSRDFGFRTQKSPRKFDVKRGRSQKRLKYGKKYFIGMYVSRYPFIPINPLLAAMRFISFFSFFFLFFPFFSFFFFFFPFFSFFSLFFSFFSFFFFQIFYALLLLNHKTSKSNFCVKLLSCKCNFFSLNFLGQLHRGPPQNGAPKTHFLNGSR